jgi:hypothetical protein
MVVSERKNQETGVMDFRPDFVLKFGHSCLCVLAQKQERKSIAKIMDRIPVRHVQNWGFEARF